MHTPTHNLGTVLLLRGGTHPPTGPFFLQHHCFQEETNGDRYHSKNKSAPKLLLLYLFRD